MARLGKGPPGQGVIIDPTPQDGSPICTARNVRRGTLDFALEGLDPGAGPGRHVVVRPRHLSVGREARENPACDQQNQDWRRQGETCRICAISSTCPEFLRDGNHMVP